MTRRQSGFSVIEGVMAFAIVALIGVVAWQAVKGHQKAVASTNQTPTPSATVTADPYAGWKLFTSTYDKGLNFRYPSNWAAKPAAGNEPGSDGIELKSPSGLVFTVWVGADGFGGGCDPDQCPVTSVFKSQSLSVPNYGTLYLQEVTITDNSGAGEHSIGLSDKHLVTYKGFPPYLMYPAKNVKETNVRVGMSSGMDSSFSKMSASQFFSMSDVKTVEKILQSWSY
jgi:hypothetical protein